MRKIKIYGERNTGTNYFINVIKQNFDISVLPGTVPQKMPLKRSEALRDFYFMLTRSQNLGWKHSIPPLDLIEPKLRNGELKVVTLIKNPYSFLLSLYKRPYSFTGKKPDSFTDFLKTTYPAQGRDNYIKKFYDSPVDLWNVKNRSYYDLSNRFPEHVTIIRYEDIIQDIDGIINWIGDKFHFELLNGGHVSNYLDSTKEKAKDFDFYKDYYLNEKWRKEVGPDEINLINSQLDDELVKDLGYKLIDS